MALQEGKVLLVCGLLLVLVFAMVHSNDMKDDEYSEIGKPPSGDFTVKEKLQVKKRKERSYGFSSFAFSGRRRRRRRRRQGWKLSVCILTTFV